MLVDIADDRFGLRLAIPKCLERARNRLIHNHHASTANECLKLSETKVWFDTRRVTVHHEADRAGWRKQACLRVTDTKLFAELNRFVPYFCGCAEQVFRHEASVDVAHRITVLA